MHRRFSMLVWGWMETLGATVLLAALSIAPACSSSAGGEDEDAAGLLPVVDSPEDGVECRSGESRCNAEGNLEACDNREDGPNPSSMSTWGRYEASVECEGECVQLRDPEDGYRAVCSAGTRPDPRCEDTPYACDGDEVITCRYGYNVGSEPHGCGDGTFCVEGLGECALSDEPDPRCPAVEPSCPAPPNEEGIWGGCQARVCDGTRAKLTCVAGYVIDEEVCGTYELCKEAPSVTSCAPPPDPRCPDEGTRLLCDGNLLVTCGGGLSEEEDCGEQTCVEEGGSANCS